MSYLSHPPIPVDRLRELVAYNPDRGVFTWKQDRRPRAKAGATAGNTNQNGYYIVTLDGHAYNALPLALYYVDGVWPEGRVVPDDGDVGNAAWGNIIHTDPELSTEKAAVYMRTRREKLKADRKDSPIPGITWSDMFKNWAVRLPGRPNSYVDGRVKTFEEAVRLYYARLAAEERVDALGYPPEHPDFARILCGVEGTALPLSLQDLHRTWCYDPDNGQIYLRRNPYTKSNSKLRSRTPGTETFSKGIRADTAGYRGTRVLRYEKRDYPVHMIAVLMATGAWPPIRTVTFVNGDHKDPRWANIRFVGKKPEFSFYDPEDPAAQFESRRDRRRKPLD
jgi:hypothetical protein